MLMIAGRNADAIAACEPTLEYAPESILCSSGIGPAYLLDGKLDKARPYYDQWARNWGKGTDRQVAELFDALEGKGDRRSFARSPAATPDRSWNDPGSGNLFSDCDIPVLLVQLGEQELALQYQKLTLPLQKAQTELCNLQLQLKGLGWHAVVKYQTDSAQIMPLKPGIMIHAHPELYLVLDDYYGDRCRLKLLKHPEKCWAYVDDCDRIQKQEDFQISLHRRREDAESLAAKLQ